MGYFLIPSFPAHTFRNLNIFKANIEPLKEELRSVNWDELRSLCTEEEFPELLRLTTLQICENHCTSKTGGSSRCNKFIKERRILNRKSTEYLTRGVSLPFLHYNLCSNFISCKRCQSWNFPKRPESFASEL